MDFNGIIDGIEKASGIRFEDGDYIQGGLLYCGKCHTPKQTIIEVFGTIRKPYCLCKCEKARLDVEQAEFERKQREREIMRLRRVGFHDAEMARWTFANDDRSNERLSEVARRYVDNFPEMRKRGKGLLLYGNVGAGKTYAAACIANALIDQGKPCLVTNFARLINTIGGMFDGKQEYIDSLNRFELLVIDDLASERDTEYMGEIVHNVIDARYRSGKPLIVTTNLTMQELLNPSDLRRQRVFSRVLEMCVPIEVKGADRRKKRMGEDFSEIRGMLGL